MSFISKPLRTLVKASGFPVASYGNIHWKITQPVIGHLRGLSYLEQWKLSVASDWFHIKLEDHSLFIFNDDVGNPYFQYLECPINVQSIRMFLANKRLRCNQKNISEYADEYQLEFDTAPLKPNVTPIRYDLDQRGYEQGCHPLAHLHIGLDNNVRLAVRRRMTPCAFVLFVMRQMYPFYWKKLLLTATELRINRRIRDELMPVEAAYWAGHDSLALFLD